MATTFHPAAAPATTRAWRGSTSCCERSSATSSSASTTTGSCTSPSSGVRVEPDLHRAVSSTTARRSRGRRGGLGALGELRIRLQAAIGSPGPHEAHPRAVFRADPSVRSGERIELDPARDAPGRGDRTWVARTPKPGLRGPNAEAGPEARAPPGPRAGHRRASRSSTSPPAGPATTSWPSAAGCSAPARSATAGTLDPTPPGCSLLGVGRATRLLRFLAPLGKSYVGEIVLGTETSTLDAAGEVTGHPRHGRHDARRRAGRGRRLTGDICRCRRWCRPSRSTAGGSTSWPGGHRGRARAPAGDRAPRSTSSRRARRALGVPDRGRLLVGHLHPLAGRRPRRRPRRRRPPPQPPPHGRRVLRRVGGPPPRRRSELLAPRSALRDYPVGGGRRRAARRCAPRPGAAGRGVPGGWPIWAVLDGDGALLAVYEPHREGSVKPAVVLAPAG